MLCNKEFIGSHVDADVSEPPVLVAKVLLEAVELLPAGRHAQTVTVELEHGPANQYNEDELWYAAERAESPSMQMVFWEIEPG